MALQLDDRKAGLLLVVIANILWGTVFVASQVGLEFTNPYNVAFLRFFAAAVPIALFGIISRDKGILKWLKSGWIWLFGFVYAVGVITQYVGQALTSTPEATLLSNLSPILIPPLAIVMLKDKMTKAQAVAVLFGIAGLLLVASPRIGLGLEEIIGDVLLFLTSLCYALFTIFNKKFSISAADSSFAIIIAITVFSFAAAVLFGGFNPANLTIGASGWSAIIYLGVACTAVGITTYLRGLRSIKASEASFLFLLQVLVGLALSGILFGEFLSYEQTAGAIAIILALVFGIRTKTHGSEADPGGIRS